MLQRLALRGTPKATKAAARYTPAGGAERCGMCRHYVPSSSCARIEGPVSAAGWCMLYSQQVTWRPRAGQDAGGGVPAGLTLDLSFLTPGTLDPSITFTRTSTATYFDVTGTMQTAAINAPRWDYDRNTHALNGLLMEEPRINILLNSATLGTQSVAVTAQVYTLSFTGTGTITKSGTATGALVGTGVTQRVSQTFTPTAGTLTCTVTGSVSSAQLEAGAFATSYIPTVGATVTRAGDSAIVASTPWYNASASTLATEYMVGYSALAAGGAANCSMQLDNTTQTEVLVLRHLPTTIVGVTVFSANAVVGSGTAGVIAAGVVSKHAAAFNSASLTTALTAFNGAAAVSFSMTAYPSGLNRLVVGAGRNLPLGGWIRRLRYWNRALSAAELQSVTT